MYEQFTTESLKAIMFAGQHGSKFNQTSLNCDFILVGILETYGVGRKILQAQSVTLLSIQQQIERIYRKSRGPVSNPFDQVNPRALQLFDLAKLAAQIDEDCNYISTRHLLIGFIDEASEHPEAPCLLKNCDIDLPRCRLLATGTKDLIVGDSI